ncbi:MAG: helix-turn-helix transcriptional regulator [Thermoguttaceae bacterium]|nr:helix-turn-helix transcriptional regulator [Thermoguttaceae bacterium]
MLIRVKKVLDDLNISQAQLARDLNFTRGYVSHLLKGERELSASFIAQFCLAYNVNEQWLRTGVGEMFLTSQDEPYDERTIATRWLTQQFTQLPQSLQDDLLAFAENLLEQTKGRKKT